MHHKRTLITLERNVTVTPSGAFLSLTAALWQQISPGVHSDLITEASRTFIARVMWAASRRAPISCLQGEAVARAHAPPSLRYFSHYTIFLQRARRCGIYLTHFPTVFPPANPAVLRWRTFTYVRGSCRQSTRHHLVAYKKSAGLIITVCRKFSLHLRQLLRT